MAGRGTYRREPNRPLAFYLFPGQTPRTFPRDLDGRQFPSHWPELVRGSRNAKRWGTHLGGKRLDFLNPPFTTRIEAGGRSGYCPHRGQLVARMHVPACGSPPMRPARPPVFCPQHLESLGYRKRHARREQSAPPAPLSHPGWVLNQGSDPISEYRSDRAIEIRKSHEHPTPG